MEGSTCPSLCELPLCWEQSAPQRAQVDRSCCHSPAGTAGTVILLVGVHFPWTQQILHKGGSVALKPALLPGEKSLSMPVGLCWAKQQRVWATLAFTRDC